MLGLKRGREEEVDLTYDHIRTKEEFLDVFPNFELVNDRSGILGLSGDKSASLQNNDTLGSGFSPLSFTETVVRTALRSMGTSLINNSGLCGLSPPSYKPISLTLQSTKRCRRSPVSILTQEGQQVSEMDIEEDTGLCSSAGYSLVPVAGKRFEWEIKSSLRQDEDDLLGFIKLHDQTTEDFGGVFQVCAYLASAAQSLNKPCSLHGAFTDFTQWIFVRLDQMLDGQTGSWLRTVTVSVSRNL